VVGTTVAGIVDEPTGPGAGRENPVRRLVARTVVPNARVLTAACTLLAALSVTQLPGGAPAGPPPPPVDPVTQRAVPLELGVTTFVLSRDWDQRDDLLDQIKESGSRWVRVDLDWCTLEQVGAGRVDVAYQERLDLLTSAARELDLRLLVQLSCAPRWAGGTDANSYPTDVGQVERIARYLGDRYRGRVAAWEIWDEPNCVGGCPNGSPEQYVEVLKAAYRGLKGSDGDTTVVGGGTNGNDVEWLRRMYAAGAAGWFDALAVHTFQEPASAAPDAPSGNNAYRLSTLPRVREVMLANGDGARSIWLTEFGWTTARTGPRSGVSDSNQAQFLRQAVRQIDAQYPYVSTAIWYYLRDRDDATPYENNFGLIHVRGSVKPSFGALQKANAELTADR
jgi:hypothetical protein